MAIGVGVVYLAVLLPSLCVWVGGRPFLPALSVNAKCRIPGRRDSTPMLLPPMLLAQVPPRPTRP